MQLLASDKVENQYPSHRCKMPPYYAHSLPNQPPEKWETMEQHEQQVAQLCAGFFSRIHPDLGPWGDLLGRWHDLGKYSRAFQNYLATTSDPDASSETRTGKVDHSTAGAQHATSRLGPFGRLIAYCIAGHHAGLPDAFTATSSKAGALNDRLKKQIDPFQDAPAGILDLKRPPNPQLNLENKDTKRLAFQISLLGRMMFSALCDADFLATESFMSPNREEIRSARKRQPIGELKRVLTHHLDSLSASADPTNVNIQRKNILENSLAAAGQLPGLFSLTVPTGGGKTLASLAFALDHASKHKMERVIYAIPFTSIIEQTAEVFRHVFRSLGDDVVLEHHSSLEPEQESRSARMATENWDSSLIVTTNVQFFESLFANKTSRCRKLHRIARSVIILDEAQTIPVELLQPALATLRELTTVFGCTVVLCTATQPAIGHHENFPIGLSGIREIIPDPQSLYANMRRVTSHPTKRLADEQLIESALQHASFLCIVNTRAHASRLFEMAGGNSRKDTFHLSTFMTGRHRSVILRRIRRRLDLGRPCRVFSTQLVEAGVDVDFPVVFRALTGLDSIAQAAGRCNREGRLDHGQLFVFEPENVTLRGYLKTVAETAAELIPIYPDLLDPEAISHYFRLHYSNHKNQWDAHDVMSCFPDPAMQAFQYRSAAERFEMIPDSGQNIFIPFGVRAIGLEKQIRSRKFADDPAFRRFVLRRAGRHMVSLYSNAYSQLLGTDIELVHDQVPVLINTRLYDPATGLRTDRAGQHEPEGLIL